MIRIGVLRGGTSARYTDSLGSGAFVLRSLPRDKYEPVDVFVDPDGVWHIGGKPVSYDMLRHRVDVLWNALHGFYGEDGKVQQMLESLGIPYVGSGPLASSIAMNKKLSKESLATVGIETPRGMYIESWGDGDRDETVATVVSTIARKFSPPWIVEPISRARAAGAVHPATRDELTLVLSDMFDLRIPVSVEEAVFGRELSVVAVRGFREEPIYTFPARYIDDPEARVTHAASEEIQELAKKIHNALHLGHYSRLEAIVTPKGKVCVTAVETMPNTGPVSDLHHALASTGVSFREFAEHLIELARAK